MKFVMFVEGDTEKKVLGPFIKRWLDRRLESKKVGLQVVRFGGWADYLEDVGKKALMYLGGKGGADVIAVVGLLDLYGPDIYPDTTTTAQARIEWATAHIQSKVGHERFRQFFAVHELEAWLLSDPGIFPKAVHAALPIKKLKHPEQVNFDKPPAKLLGEVYLKATRKGYKKTTDGFGLFGKLDPETAICACPNLKLMLDTMCDLA